MDTLPKNPSFESFHLSDSQLFTLFFYAYVGREGGYSVGLPSLSNVGLNKDNVLKDREVLYDCGLLTNLNPRNFMAEVDPVWFIYVAQKLYTEYPSLYRKLEVLKWHRGLFTSRLWNLVIALCDNSNNAKAKAIDTYLLGYYSDHHYLIPLLVQESYWPALKGILPESFRTFVISAAQELIDYDECFESLMTWIERYADYYTSANEPVSDTFSFIALTRYITQGQAPTRNLAPDQYSLAIEAIQHLYCGDNEGALKLFASALKYHNAQSKEKNYFDNPLLNLMLIVCYQRIDTPDTRKKMQQLLNKRSFVDNPHMAVPVTMLYYLLDGKSDQGKSHIRSLASRSDISKFDLALLLVANKKFNLTLSRLGFTANELKYHPCSAILRYELEAFTTDHSPDYNDLKKAFGGEPILAHLSVKEKWEVTLEELLHDIAPSPARENNSSDRRIVYIVHEHVVEVREQKRLKSGNWGVGTKASRSSLINMELDCMDETDVAIAKVIQRTDYSYELHPTMVLPLLVGNDRVLVDSIHGFIPLRVVEEVPFLTIQQEKDKLVIGTNLPDTKYGSIKRVMLEPRAQDLMVVYNLTSYQVKVFQQLLALKEIPLSASDYVKRFIEQISSKIEIHSSLIQGGSLLQQLEGNANIILRIEPCRDGSFDVLPQVHPLEGGQVSVSPDRGKQVIFDEVEGVRYQVMRNIAAERANMQALTEQVGLDIDSEGSNISTECMLDLVQFVQEHGPTYQLEWLEGTKYKVKKVSAEGAVSIGLTSRENWFDVEGSVDLGDGQMLTPSQFLQLLQMGVVGRRYVRLSDGEYAQLNEQLLKQLQQLSDLAQFDRKGAHIPRYHVGAIAEILDKNSTSMSADKEFEKLKKKIMSAAKMKIPVPEQLKAELRDYQEEGFRWMVRLTEWGAGACLADDMGLGKTVQAIALMLHRASKGASLVLCPASVIYNWKSELQRFAPSLDTYILSEAEDRQALLKQMAPYGVLLCTYGLLVREAELLRGSKWNLLVLDEAHTIKNRSTKMSAAAMDLEARSRIILTGTPVQNYLSELWNLFQFINPGLLGSFEQFTNRYILPIERDENKAVQAQLRHAIQPFLLRRTKNEVIEELPDKTEITHLVTLTDAERTAYEALRISAQEEVDSQDKLSVNVLSMITRLREAACSMSLVADGWVGECSKLNAFRDLVEQIIMGGNRVLVFSQFTSFLGQARDILSQAGIEYYYLDGSTPTRRRADMVKQFQHGSVPVFLISLKAGGLGLNLTGANYVIHLDPWWNPAIEQQATDRAYRIGQHQNVTVYHLISDHTIEQKILRMHKTKRDMADALLEGSNLGHAMTLDDLKFLVQKI